MDKKNKREIRQTGMTDKRIKALESIRELKNSGLSRLDQAIQVRIINIIYINIYRKEKLIIK